MRAAAPLHPIKGLFAWLLVCFITATTGSIASVNAKTFYAQLSQPDWAPPAYLFAPVWSTLYVLMAISAWLVWRQGGFKAAQTALLLFLLQLGVNALWSWLFFSWHLGALAFVDICLLWTLIAATIVAFWRIKPLAAALLIPYFLWVSFALALNYSVWQLNPQWL